MYISLKSINQSMWFRYEVNHTLPLLFFFAVFNMLEKQNKKNHKKENTHRKPSHNHQKQIQWLEELQQHWHQWTHKITHSFVKIPPKKMCVLVLIDHTHSLLCVLLVLFVREMKNHLFFWMILSFFFEFFFDGHKLHLLKGQKVHLWSTECCLFGMKFQVFGWLRL